MPRKLKPMRMRFFLIYIFVIISSCSTKRNIIYIQDSDIKKHYNTDYKDYLIKVDDVLKIDIKTVDPELALLFNKDQDNNLSSSKDAILYNGYQVNSDGNINFPEIGNIKVAGLTTTEIGKDLYNEITEQGILLNPSIDVKVIKSHFTILGEVNNPGTYTVASVNSAFNI